MRHFLPSTLGALLILAPCCPPAAGQAGTPGERVDPPPGPAGRSVLGALQSEVRESAAALRESVVTVKLVGYARSNPGAFTVVGGRLQRAAPSSSLTLTGVVVSDAGHVLVAGGYEADKVEQVEVRIGKLEATGQILRKDESLDMTLIQTDPNPSLKSVFSLPSGELSRGDFAVLMEAGQESWDYEPMLSLALCRGAIPGNYTKYLLDETSARLRGAPAATLDGKFAGLFSGAGEVLAIADIREDLLEMIRKAESGNGSEEDETEEKGWMGAMVHAVNEDYARLKSLPEHALMVTHVAQDSPASKAGMRPGDLVIGVQRKPLRFSGERARNLFFHLLRPRKEQPFRLTVLRDGEEIALQGVFGEVPEPETLQADDLGVTVSDVGSEDAVKHNLFHTEGVRVTEVKKGSAAAVSGSTRRTLLQQNDVIVALGGTPTPDVAAFRGALQGVRQRGDEILLVHYWRGRISGFAGLNLDLGEN